VPWASSTRVTVKCTGGKIKKGPQRKRKGGKSEGEKKKNGLQRGPGAKKARNRVSKLHR